jgi:phosphoserine aminotransferase
MPKLFRMKKGGKVDRAIFEGDTINTPSLLCVEDYLDALKWAGEIGGLDGLIERSLANLKVVEAWVGETPWIDFLAASPEIRSNTSVCLSVVSKEVQSMEKEARTKFLKGVAGELSKKGVAHDVASYRDAPQGFRFWCGPTIETEDIKVALSELERMYNEKIKTI